MLYTCNDILYITAGGKESVIKLFFLFRSEVLFICAAARVYLMALLFNSLDIFLRPVNIMAYCCAFAIFMGHFGIQSEI